jgi:dolichyl-phosphate beta-glucosyltransferase
VPDALELSLVIPVYNQRTRAIQAVQEARTWLQERYRDRAELIVVDDGSRAGQALQEADLPPDVTLLRHDRNRGKGGAVRTGMARARGRYAVFTDSDLPFSLAPLPETLQRLRDGADVVIGDRLHPESVAETPVGPLRRLSSVVYTWMVNHALGLDFPDTQCGYKGYRIEAARDLFGRLEITSFAFDAELLLRARARGYRVVRQPVHLVHNDDSSVSLLRHAPGMVLDMARLFWRRRRGAL